MWHQVYLYFVVFLHPCDQKDHHHHGAVEMTAFLAEVDQVHMHDLRGQEPDTDKISYKNSTLSHGENSVSTSPGLDLVSGRKYGQKCEWMELW